MQGPHARAVSCPLCSEKFFPASLPFHVKQCEQRRASRRVNCPYCSAEVSQLELPKHIENCPKGAKRRQGSAGPRGGGGGGTAGEAGAAASGGRPNTACPPAAPGQFDPEMLEDGRMRCIYCGRYFNPDRIDKHQQICSKLQSARPKGVDGQPTQTNRKVFDAEAQRLGKGPCFVTPEKYERKQRAAQTALQQAKASGGKSSWRREHEDFQAACRAGRGDADVGAASPSGQGRDGGKVACPHCSRLFDPQAAERHIPICANVRNRARPPPSSPGAGGRGATPSPRAAPRAAPRGAPRAASPGRAASSPGPVRGGGTSRSPARPPATPPAGGAPPAPVGAPPASAGRRVPSAPRAAAGGGGAQAARSLRSSHGRLPGLPPSVGAAGGAGSGAERALPHTPRRSTPRAWPLGGGAAQGDTLDPREAALDRTATPRGAGAAGQRAASPAASPAPGGATPRQSAVARVGLRRSAMLYRLLSQVPDEALEKELADCGIEAEAAGLHDKESMIEALLEELS